LTRLITSDSFPLVRLPREWLLEKAIENRIEDASYETVDDATDEHVRTYRGFWYHLADLVTCPWCVSVWVAGVVTFITVLVSPTGLSMPWLWFGATAGGAAITAQLVAKLMD
jgi:hypothetical protein